MAEADATLRHVIVGVDGSPGGFAALRRAIAMTLERNARLTIVAAVEQPSPIVVWGGALVVTTVMRQNEQAARECLSAALQHVPASLPVTTRVCLEPVCSALRAYGDGAYDLVVVGETRRRGIVRGAWRRGVGSRLSRDPTVRVLIVASASPAMS